MKGDISATRDAFSKALVEFGKDNEKVVVLDADLAHATMSASAKMILRKECFISKKVE